MEELIRSLGHICVKVPATRIEFKCLFSSRGTFFYCESEKRLSVDPSAVFQRYKLSLTLFKNYMMTLFGNLFTTGLSVLLLLQMKWSYALALPYFFFFILIHSKTISKQHSFLPKFSWRKLFLSLCVACTNNVVRLIRKNDINRAQCKNAQKATFICQDQRFQR